MKRLSTFILQAIAALLFFFFPIVPHPWLVVYIISQAETPLLIRIGAVIITYLILIAALWLSFEIGAFEKQERSSGCMFIIFISVCLPLLLSLGIIAGSELLLRDQLLQKGISGVATVERCEEKKHSRGGNTCYISYEYKARLANNTTRWYRVREEVSCARECYIGFSVYISYLSQTPSQAGIEGNTHILKRSFTLFILALNTTIMCFFYELHNLTKSASKWLTRSSKESKEVEITPPTSLKDQPFKLDKEEIVREALRTNPQNARAWLILGWIMTRAEGKLEQARECYERAFKINLRSYPDQALELPTWVNLVAAYDLPLGSSSAQNNPIPLPNWLDEEEKPSFFSGLRAVLLNPFMLFFFLITFVPGWWLLSAAFFGKGPTIFLTYLFLITMTMPPLIAIFYTLKLIKISSNNRNWPLSDAIVVGSFINTSKSKGKGRYSLYVVCAHQVDQQIFYSTVPSKKFYTTAPSYEDGTYKSNDFLEQKEKKYGFGKPMMVFYNPRQPDIISHQVGFNGYVLVLLLGMIGFALLFGILPYVLWQALP